jgi:hypothetical protein
MTQEQKDLLLKDICSRLPYGVILNCCGIVNEPLTLISYKGLVNNDYDIDEVKPYLLPMSSMTEEQEKEYKETTIGAGVFTVWTTSTYDWFNKNHFDYRGLIEKGLSIDATGLNIY